MVTGAAALLLDARPNLTPDQVKSLLKSTTVNASPRNPVFSGEGVIQVDKAAHKGTPGKRAIQTWPKSASDGSLEAARGDLHMVVNGVVIAGEIIELEGGILERTLAVMGPWDFLAIVKYPDNETAFRVLAKIAKLEVVETETFPAEDVAIFMKALV